jgi:predicted TIM-barrel fold metal-dependent hydrolase
MIFDAHTHVYPNGSGFWKRPSSVADLISAMDEAEVSRAAVLAIAPQIGAEVVCEAAAAHPGRLVAVGSVDPRERGAVAAVARQVEDMGVRAIKLHPRLQDIGFDDLERVTPIARQCAECGVPLVICTFLGGRDLFRARTLELCHELAAASPETALVLAHAGGYRPLDALMVLKANPNVHIDLSFSPLYFAESSVQQDLAYLVRKADPWRVLFGSDFPEVSLRDSVAWMLALADDLGLETRARDAILGGNAARLFKAS